MSDSESDTRSESHEEEIIDAPEESTGPFSKAKKKLLRPKKDSTLKKREKKEKRKAQQIWSKKKLQYAIAETEEKIKLAKDEGSDPLSSSECLESLLTQINGSGFRCGSGISTRHSLERFSGAARATDAFLTPRGLAKRAVRTGRSPKRLRALDADLQVTC